MSVRGRLLLLPLLLACIESEGRLQAQQTVPEQSVENRDHGRAQRAARIAHFRALWEAAEARPREDASALLQSLGGQPGLAPGWPSDAALAAASDVLMGGVGEHPPRPGSLREVAQSVELSFAPGWVEPVEVLDGPPTGPGEAFAVRVSLARPLAVPAGLSVNLLAPRLRRNLRGESVAAASFEGTGFELSARMPADAVEGIELVLELERTQGVVVERARSSPFVLSSFDGARERLTKLQDLAPVGFPRVDVEAARRALELCSATGWLEGLTRDPYALLGALETNMRICEADRAGVYTTPGGPRLCGPLRLGAATERRWIGWQAGPKVERVLWFWSSEEQPWDGLFIGGDPLALEWQRLGSGRSWLLVACEPTAAPVDDLRSAQEELRTAFPLTPITLVSRGEAVTRLTQAVLAGVKLQVDELVLVSHFPSAARLSPTIPTLEVTASTAALETEPPAPPAHVRRIEGLATPFLTDPVLPRLYDEWRSQRGKP
jgi:hypothetical protein